MSSNSALDIGTSNRQYKLKIVQNPIRARCCGFGEKDRRPIDPPPILQLFLEGPNGTLLNAVKDTDGQSLFVVQCDLIAEGGLDQRSHVYNPSCATPANVIGSRNELKPTSGTLITLQDPTPTRTLMGAIVSNSYPLVGPDNELGVFFIFQDLSVRVEGRFRLKFSLINLSEGNPLTGDTTVCDDVISDPFTVFSAKNFPGMTDSTALSQCFAQQGIKISIRKGRKICRVRNKSFNNEDESAKCKEREGPKKDDDDDDDNKPTHYRRIAISSYLSSPK
ncbi:velvet factor-domain-containing protein [Pilobolus umbonatus]|nr:velvet factor-domain-containing protein [Pilobolus umbonatus]